MEGLRTYHLKRTNEWKAVTVTYRRADGNLVLNRAGYGLTVEDALADADRQLADGVYTRTVVSSADSIFADLNPRGLDGNPRNRHPQGEGQTIRVEHRISEVLLDER